MSTADPERQGLYYYYEREREYLLNAGADFSRRYPKIARRLTLDAPTQLDPNIERLIESFAFLTARIQRNYDSEFPEAAQGLLSLIQPHLVSPLPSACVVEFQPDPLRITGSEMPVVEPGTAVSAHSTVGVDVSFTTSWATPLLPLGIREVSVDTAEAWNAVRLPSDVASVVRITFDAKVARSLGSLNIKILRLFFDLSTSVYHSFVESVESSCLGAFFIGDIAEQPIFMPRSSVSNPGFEVENTLLPPIRNSLPHTRGLYEWAAYREKFSFLDIKDLPLHAASREFTLLILLGKEITPAGRITKQTVRLNCTPAVNLFVRSAEPVTWRHTTYEERMRPVQMEDRAAEIHTVMSVSTVDSRGIVRPVQPYFAFRSSIAEQSESGLYWYSSRRDSIRKGVLGTDVFLSLVDTNFQPGQAADETVFAKLLCTNRDMASEVPAGALLVPESPLPVLLASAVTKPTRAARRVVGGEGLWKAVGHVYAHRLSMASDAQALESLKESISLYCSLVDDRYAASHIPAIASMSTRRITRPISTEAWRGMVTGTEVTLTVDETLLVEGSAIILGGVLNNYFALRAATNSFTQLRLRSLQRQGEWMVWPPRAGMRPLL